MAREEIRSRTDAAIQTFSLEHLRGRSLDVLSSGEKQRVAIASVYALRPGVYVCDEPTANLDGEGSEQLAETLKKLKAEGCTLVIAEHRLAWLSGIADRFLYLANGRILWEKSPAEMARMSAGERGAYGPGGSDAVAFPGFAAAGKRRWFYPDRGPILQKKRQSDLSPSLAFGLRRADHCHYRPQWSREDQPCHGAVRPVERERRQCNDRRGKTACRRAAPGGSGTAPTTPAHSFLPTASRRNCCWATTARSPAGTGQGAFEAIGAVWV